MPQYMRQIGLINIEEFVDNHILIVGCGAIGSFTAISLAKMGLKEFTLVDFDTVEEHNLPNQFFTRGNINQNKAFVTANNMHSFNTDCWPARIDKPFNSKMRHGSHIVISCVDNMKTRKQIFNNAKRNNVQLFIDARMAGLQGQIYTVDMSKKSQIKTYEKSLFTDDEAQQVRCTDRSIIFTVLGVASFICNQIVKAFNEEELSNYIVLDYKANQVYG